MYAYTLSVTCLNAFLRLKMGYGTGHRESVTSSKPVLLFLVDGGQKWLITVHHVIQIRKHLASWVEMLVADQSAGARSLFGGIFRQTTLQMSSTIYLLYKSHLPILCTEMC